MARKNQERALRQAAERAAAQQLADSSNQTASTDTASYVLDVLVAGAAPQPIAVETPAPAADAPPGGSPSAMA